MKIARIILAFSLASALAPAAFAQAADPHHSPQAATPTPSPTLPPSPGQPGMGDMAMMNMTGSMSIVNMMGMRRMMGSGMATVDGVEGRIAFLRTELKITEDQVTVWSAFAVALPPRQMLKPPGQMLPGKMQPSAQPQTAPLQHPGSGMYTPNPTVQRQAFAAGDSVRGEKAYATACAGCHASLARITRSVKGRTPEQRRVWLDAFLSKHHAPDEAIRADVIAFVLTK